MAEYTVTFTAITWGGTGLEDETVTVCADCAEDALIAAERIMSRRHQDAMATRIEEAAT
jgi:hypothetical protein